MHRIDTVNTNETNYNQNTKTQQSDKKPIVTNIPLIDSSSIGENVDFIEIFYYF